MTAADFRRIALSLERVEDYSHAGWPAFGCDPSAVTMWLRVRLTSAEFAAHSKRRATRRTPNGEYLLRGGFLSLSPLVSDLQWNRESLRIFLVYRDTNSWKMWWSIETGQKTTTQDICSILNTRQLPWGKRSQFPCAGENYRVPESEQPNIFLDIYYTEIRFC
jgi:hypothetical protein